MYVLIIHMSSCVDVESPFPGHPTSPLLCCFFPRASATFPIRTKRWLVDWQVADISDRLSNNQNDNEGTRELMNFTTDSNHPGAGRKVERQEARGRGLEGMVIDSEETRRRNDGYIHLRHADTTMEAEVPEQGKAKL